MRASPSTRAAPKRRRPAKIGPESHKSEAPRSSEAAARRLAVVIGHGAQGAARARALAREGARSRADLKRPAVLARLPREAQANVLYNLARGVPLAEAEAVAAEVRRRLVFAPARPAAVVVVGSVRRLAPRVKDLDFLVVAPPGLSPADRDRLLASAALRPRRPGDRLAIADTYAAGARHRALVLCAPAQPRPSARRRCYRVDLFLCAASEKPFALFHYTGAKAYNIRTRALAKKKGWRLNQYGLFEVETGLPVRGSAAIRTERDLARFLGVSHREPPDRTR